MYRIYLIFYKKHIHNPSSSKYTSTIDLLDVEQMNYVNNNPPGTLPPPLEKLSKFSVQNHFLCLVELRVAIVVQFGLLYKNQLRCSHRDKQHHEWSVCVCELCVLRVCLHMRVRPCTSIEVTVVNSIFTQLMRGSLYFHNLRVDMHLYNALKACVQLGTVR